MSDKDKLLFELIYELELCSIEKLEEMRLILLSVSADDPVLVHFLERVFAMVKRKQPLLLEMKHSAA